MKTIADPAVIAGLEARLERVTPDSTRRFGTLTPGEMFCHLADVAQVVLEESHKDSKPAPRKPWLKWLGLYLPIPWPTGYKSPPGADPKGEGSRPTEFERDRRRVVDGLRKLAAADRLPKGHKVFGAMTRKDWHRWAYRHTDHHLRQFGA